MHPETKQSSQIICAVYRPPPPPPPPPPSPWQSASGGPGHPSPFKGGAAGTSIPASQPLKLFPEDRTGANTRKIGDIFSPCLNTSGTLELPCSSGPSVQWHRISSRHSSFGVAEAPGPMAVAKAPETSGDFRMLTDVARDPPDPNFTQPVSRFTAVTVLTKS